MEHSRSLTAVRVTSPIALIPTSTRLTAHTRSQQSPESHTLLDTPRGTFTFQAGPLKRDPNSSTLRLPYKPQNSVVYAYENALSESLTKLGAVESYESKAVRDVRKELVVQIEGELVELEKKVMEVPGVGEEEVEEKVGELNDEEVEKAVVEDK